MCKFIGSEILAANALIELFELSKINKVKFDQLDAYGIQAVQYYQNKFKDKMVIFISKSSFENLVIDYSDCFEIKNSELYIKQGVTTDLLRERFRGPLMYEVFKTLVSRDVIKALGIFE